MLVLALMAEAAAVEEEEAVEVQVVEEEAVVEVQAAKLVEVPTKATQERAERLAERPDRNVCRYALLRNIITLHNTCETHVSAG